jgi:maltose alpha-D-glucosyltransferase / alpha-amylase
MPTNLQESPAILGEWIAKQRWFGGKSKAITEWQIEAFQQIGNLALIAIRAHYAEGQSEAYFVPLSSSREGNVLPGFSDAISEPVFHNWLHASLQKEPSFHPYSADNTAPSGVRFDAEQSNSALILDGKFFVKIYRRLTPGPSPDAEMLRYLSEDAAFPYVPKYFGLVRWEKWPIALATSVVQEAQNAWDLALKFAREFYETGNHGEWPKLARELGQRTGEMHATLAGAIGPDFEAEAFTAEDFDAVATRIRALESSTRKALEQPNKLIPDTGCALAQHFLREKAYRPEKIIPQTAVKTRVHGDFHLGQVLWNRGDFVIIDFEGEPARSLAERRSKNSPIRDIAGMLRSFHYAAHSAGSGADAEKWASVSSEAFLAGWTASAPKLAVDLPLLPLFLREKALYELDYEINNRPDWTRIPLLALTLK